MLQAASQDCGAPLSLQGLQGFMEEPQRLERGLKVLDVGLRLTPDLVLDVVLRDQASRPVVVLGEGNDGPRALLGRAVCALAEVRRMRDLLERLFRQEGVSFGADPRVILVARRFSDALHDACDLLAPLKVELVEAHEVPFEGRNRLVVVRAGGAAAKVASPAADPSAAAAAAPAPSAAGEKPVQERTAAAKSAGEKAAASERAAARAAGNGNGHGTARVASLIDEAKKKILRISDDIEEEVDRGLVRFRLHDELIAVLEQSAEGCAVTVGDVPERRRALLDRTDLDAVVDDVVRRYFTLARQFAGKPPAPRAPVPAT